MKTKITVVVSLIFGFLFGIIFTAAALNISAQKMMIKELKSPFDFEKTVRVMVDRINQKPGWHVTAVIDQNSEVKKNGGFEIGKFTIIKYCHGKFAARMLAVDSRKKIGNMMPKSFAVYEKSDGQVYISTMNGAVIGKLFGGRTEEIIEESSLEIEDIMRFVNLKYTLF
ncbi:DUF302 domain-containing protein [Myxococcota bacterium]|nr:DUF302 domain-containing protein [Myxococcota bacterium]MBU1536555.1 DUF302 domain-containing protein [Myxococcota bacterium]